MKKFIEFIFIVFIFYGIYALSMEILPFFVDTFDPAILVVSSLFFAAIILLIYRLILQHEAKKKAEKKVKHLHLALQEKEKLLSKRESFEKNPE